MIVSILRETWPFQYQKPLLKAPFGHKGRSLKSQISVVFYGTPTSLSYIYHYYIYYWLSISYRLIRRGFLCGWCHFFELRFETTEIWDSLIYQAHECPEQFVDSLGTPGELMDSFRTVPFGLIWDWLKETGSSLKRFAGFLFSSYLCSRLLTI